jgi:hypothetical protein
VNFTLVWLDQAEADILRHYLTARAAGLAEEYTRAVARAEVALERDAANAGESRAGHQRVLIEAPLTIEFEVHADQRTAIVVRAHYTAPHGT